MLTPQQLCDMAKHVEYEVYEFRASIHALVRIGEARPAEWNRTLESALLHFRNLRGFFFGERNGADDVFACHYIQDWPHTAAESRMDAPNIFGKTREPINKYLTHLTLTRTLSHNWTELNTMNEEMEKLIEEFKSKLTPEQTRWFGNLHRTAPKIVMVITENMTTSAPPPAYGFVLSDSDGIPDRAKPEKSVVEDADHQHPIPREDRNNH